MASAETEARLRLLPKVELHQHVDGSIPVEVTWSLMRHYRLAPVDTDRSVQEIKDINQVARGG